MWQKFWKILNTTYLKWLITAIVIAFLYKQLFYDKNIKLLSETIFLKFNFSFIFIFLLSLLLSFANWFLEALKWQLSLKNIEKISLKKSIFSVYAGISTCFFVPNRAGDFIGKLSFISSSRQKHAFISHLICGFSQLFTTLFFGILSCFMLVYFFDFESNILHITNIVSIVLILVFILFLTSNRFKHYLARVLKGKFDWLQIAKFVKENISKRSLNSIVIISLGRYMIFNFQLFLYCYFFEVPIPFAILFLIFFAMYFISTVIPTFVFSEVGVRVSVIVWLCSIYFKSANINASDDIFLYLMISTSLVWAINVFLPALLGLIVYNIKSK